jgi:hypothetical protein
MFYYVFGVFLLNDIPLRNIFKRASYRDTSIMRIIGSFGAAQSLSTLVISILFMVLNYAGDVNLLVAGVVSSAIVVIIGLVRYQTKKDRFYLKLTHKLCLWSAVGVVAYFVF